MSVVAFDDLPEEWVSEPFLTVAAQPAYEIGQRGATLLLQHISSDHEPTGESVVLPFELRVRRSSAPPRVRPRGVTSPIARPETRPASPSAAPDPDPAAIA
jgi:hypothetical protein